MNRKQWDSCDDVSRMLKHLGGSGRATDRKLRLFACACCRRHWRKLTDKDIRRGIEVGERFADGEVSDRQRGAAYAAASRAAKEQGAFAGAASSCSVKDIKLMGAAVWSTCIYGDLRKCGAELPKLAALFRDIIGNPFCPAVLAPTWRTTDVVRLTQAAYDDRLLPSGHLDPVRLLVLADALEDAGCLDEVLLGHLRNGESHVRGCWAVDRLLSRD